MLHEHWKDMNSSHLPILPNSPLLCITHLIKPLSFHLLLMNQLSDMSHCIYEAGEGLLKSNSSGEKVGSLKQRLWEGCTLSFLTWQSVPISLKHISEWLFFPLCRLKPFKACNHHQLVFCARHWSISHFFWEEESRVGGIAVRTGEVFLEMVAEAAHCQKEPGQTFFFLFFKTELLVPLTSFKKKGSCWL